MRPIDALREKIVLWKKSTTDTSLMSVLHDVLQQIDVAIYEMDHQDAASPWHMVEEKPKEADQYFVIWENNGDRGGGAAWFSLRLGWIWGGPKITHWMPIELPKEGMHENRDYPQ